MSHQNTGFTGSIPENYDRYLGPLWFEPYAQDIAGRVSVPDDGAVLELACGTGIVTRRLRERLPANVRLVATDLNEPMIAFAKRKFTEQERIEWKQADMTELSFDDEFFDAVVCQFGIMFVPDKQRVFQEVLRVLKPGCSFLFNVWDSMDHNDLARVTHQTIVKAFPADPPRFFEIPYGFNDREAITAMLENAGFQRIEFDVLKFPSVASSAAEISNGLIKGTPVFGAINERGPGYADRIQAAVAEEIANQLGDNPVSCSIQAVVFEATK
ncbi:MAG TPA: class I SAM-dependent methyltransferase [Pyrinomonadaceae bacterium]|nr:class I SAM-dependent methyltransferase [Pyrinomonadaceae bacterium]